MKLFIVAVRDSAAGCFSPPQVVGAQQQAVRGLADQVNSANGGIVAEHPEDFELYHVGFYDDQTGAVTPAEASLIARAKDLVKVRN